MAVADFVQELLSVELPFGDDFLLDKQLRAIRTGIEKANPAVVLNVSLDVRCHTAYIRRFNNTQQLLDPSIQTLAYLLILDAHIRTIKAAGKPSDRVPRQLLPQGTLWPHITSLLLNFDPVQVRYAGVAFRSLYQDVANAAEQTGESSAAIQVLHQVILRLDHTSSTLTPAHFSFVRLCLLSRAFLEAADILKRPIISLPFETDKPTMQRSFKYLCSYQESSSTYLAYHTGLNIKWTYQSYLEYFLMGGMVYMALRQFSKALFYLEVVLAAPTSNPMVTSLIQVEAYKKWVLVSLLVKGRSTSPPRAVGNSALKNMRALAKPYDCLADVFKTQDLSHLRAEIDIGQKCWQDDNNMGLVIELFHAFRKFQVQKLGNTFAALPISEVAQRTSPDPNDLTETAAYITSLIAAGELNAVMSTSSNSNQATLRFLTQASTQSEGQISHSLAYQNAELRDLLRAISNNDHRMEISKEYVDMLKKMKKAKDQGDKDGTKPVALDDLDEDMMADE